MTLRQLWVRIKALPSDAPLWVEYREAQEKAEAVKQSQAIDDALAQFQSKREG